jgi:hypothetical protein
VDAARRYIQRFAHSTDIFVDAAGDCSPDWQFGSVSNAYRASFPPAFSEMSEPRVPARARSAEDLTECATVGLVGRRSIRKITIKHNPLPDWQIW